jgi:hypothetical protein
MAHVTQKLIEIGGNPVEVKARIEKNRWVIITFTPTFSIRSAKLDLPASRETFITAILCSLINWDDETFDESYAELEETIKLVTGNFNVHQGT